MVLKRPNDFKFVTSIHLMVLVYLVLVLLSQVLAIIKISTNPSHGDLYGYLREAIDLVGLQVLVMILCFISYRWLQLHQRYFESSPSRFNALSLCMLVINLLFFVSQVSIKTLVLTKDLSAQTGKGVTQLLSSLQILFLLSILAYATLTLNRLSNLPTGLLAKMVIVLLSLFFTSILFFVNSILLFKNQHGVSDYVLGIDVSSPRKTLLIFYYII